MIVFSLISQFHNNFVQLQFYLHIWLEWWMCKSYRITHKDGGLIWRECPRFWSLFNFENPKLVIFRKKPKLTFHCIFINKNFENIPKFFVVASVSQNHQKRPFCCSKVGHFSKVLAPSAQKIGHSSILPPAQIYPW